MSEVDRIVARIRVNEALGLGDLALLVSEIERLRAERKKLFDLVSSFKTPLFSLAQTTHSVLLRIDGQIYDVCRAWFDEHGYPGENGLTVHPEKV